MKRKTLANALGRALQRLFIVALATGLALGAGPTLAAHAAAFTVNSTTDAVDAAPGDGVCATVGGDCTLRAAIQEANTLAGDDTISLPAGTYTLTIPGFSENDAATGDLDVKGNLTITGAGAATTIIDGNSSVTGDRVWHLLSGNVAITGVTIRNGNPNADGGGIFNQSASTVTVSDSIISGNTGTRGGGIYSETTLTLTNSTVSGNSATQWSGGGIYNRGGTLTLVGSTISGNNAAGSGGGILKSVFSIMLTLINSTVSGNRAGDSGGGIMSNGGPIDLYSVTIANNTADSDGDGGGDGGGIWRSSGAINFKNTVIAGNSNTGGQAPDCSGTLTSQGYNLIQNTTGCTIGGDTTGNLTGQDPLLGPLQDNGGATFTHLLLPGSPAIDAGNPAAPGGGGNACEATDQRGVARPQGARCDIGAVEIFFRLYLPLILR